MNVFSKPQGIELFVGAGSSMVAVSDDDVALRSHPTLHFPETAVGVGDEHDQRITARRRRAETWVQEKTRRLIALRRELDDQFNVTKSNKHLWEEISARMRTRGFDRLPTVCTDEWRNLLQAEFRKVRSVDRGIRETKMELFDELEGYFEDRPRFFARLVDDIPSSVDSLLDFSGNDCNRLGLNLETDFNQDGDPFDICETEPVAAHGLPPWNWNMTPESGGGVDPELRGRVITVRLGESIKNIGINGSSEAIKVAIKSAFGFRTNRAFWLQDEDGVVRSLNRDMPLVSYSLHLDKGLTIRVCLHEDPNHVPLQTEERTFYTEVGFHDFLHHRGWMGLKDTACHRNLDTLEDLHPGETYHGPRCLSG